MWMLALFAPAASGQVVLDVSELLRGAPATLTASGAVPGQRVYFAYGTPGPGGCPPQLGGLCIDLVAPTLIGSALANAAGVATVNVQVPANAPLIDLHVQAAHGGATPAKSSVGMEPVLQELNGYLAVTDGPTLDEAVHTVRASGGASISFEAGNYPTVVTLPYLESVDGWLSVSVDGRDLVLDAPRLLAATNLYVVSPGQFRATGAVVLSFPALATAGLSVSRRTDPVRISAPELVESPSVSIAETGPGTVTLLAPALEVVTGQFVVERVEGPLSLGVPSLESVGHLFLSNSAMTTLDGMFPALASVGGGILILGNPNLGAISTFGASTGVTVGEDFMVERNPTLVDISGLASVRVAAGVGYYRPFIDSNPLLPSCQAYSVGLASGAPPFCRGNALDACSDQAGDPCY